MSVSAVSTTSASPQGTTRGGPMKSLVDGINSGDADAAKQALAKLRDDRENAGAAQDTQRHHGHRTQARGDASLTYSAAATTTPTAAPGSTIDVSA